MTREDALMAMNGTTLIKVADKLGVKAACNKSRTALKEAKAKVIARILEAEAALVEQEETEPVDEELETSVVEEPETSTIEESAQDAPVAEKSKPKKMRKVRKDAIELSQEMSDTLHNMYDKLNGLYFDDLLPIANIVVRNAKRIYDCCSIRKNGESYEILMCAGTLEKPIEEIAATMLHAMVHLYCAEAEIVETCQNGRYHNAKFKAECERRNLAVAYDRANGHVYTSATEIFVEKFKEV